MKNTIKLAAIDLDGTLLGPDKTVSAENIAALRKLEAHGVEILVATGRHISRIRSYLSLIPSARWAVTCQGAAVLDLSTGKPVYSVALTPAETRLLIDLGQRLGFSCVIYAEDAVRAPKFDRMVDFYGRLAGGMPVATPLAAFANIRTHKVVWLGDEASIARLPELPEIAGLPLYHVQTHEHIYEFLPTDASKALGVAAVARKLGISPTQIAAFGDGDNDIPLFRWAGASFAMPHGTPAAREAAKSVAPEGAPESAFARAVELLENRTAALA